MKISRLKIGGLVIIVALAAIIGLFVVQGALQGGNSSAHAAGASTVHHQTQQDEVPQTRGCSSKKWQGFIPRVRIDSRTPLQGVTGCTPQGQSQQKHK